MAARRFAVDGDTNWEIDGRWLEVQRQLRQKGGSPLDPQRVLDALQAISEGRFVDPPKPGDPASALVLPQRPPLVHDLFASPEEQIANIAK